MTQAFFDPPEHVKAELNQALRRLFPNFFAETNIHPMPVSPSYERKKGVVMASVILRWQRQSDQKQGQQTADFSYQEIHGDNGGEYHWYCTSHLPNN